LECAAGNAFLEFAAVGLAVERIGDRQTRRRP
jgi:hypothetical protein